MRLFVISVICALAACSLYESGSSSITRDPPDAGNHSCGDGSGSNIPPDAGFLPDGGWVDDAASYDGGSYYPDAGSYLPDAYVGAPDAAHGPH
jgi:hypothetical protein